MSLRVFAAAAVLAGCAAVPPPAQPPRSAIELAGRSPGPPQHCVSINQAEALHVSETDPHTLVYGTGRTLWANRLGPSCGFGRDDILVMEPFGSSYCRGDLARSIDRTSHIPGPACVLGDFIPYRR
jgi:hypothetical protein